MLKNSSASSFVVDLSFLFTKLKVAYSTENRSCERKYLVEAKKEGEEIRLAEDFFPAKKKAKKFSFPFELFYYLFKSIKQVFGILLTKLKAILGLII
ncbi:MAG TPA: hypothetical protein VMW25_04915 [Clostridia bacterium]|nr:hypothetical protein [Clostridia bacterium]